MGPVSGPSDEAALHISLVSAWQMGPVSGPLDEAESWVLCAAGETTVLKPQQWRGHYLANILWGFCLCFELVSATVLQLRWFSTAKVVWMFCGNVFHLKQRNYNVHTHTPHTQLDVSVCLRCRWSCQLLASWWSWSLANSLILALCSVQMWKRANKKRNCIWFGLYLRDWCV